MDSPDTPVADALEQLRKRADLPAIPKPPGRIQRERRGFLTHLKEAPLDWLLARNDIPGLIMGWVMGGATIIATGLGIPLGTMLAINWIISQGPCVAQFIRMINENKKNGIYNPIKWDWSWWTRPQSHQKAAVAATPEVALELQFDPATFVNPKPTFLARHAPWLASIPKVGPFVLERHPWLARKILTYECRLILAAESNQRGVKRFVAGQIDDWLNQRARTPSFVIGMGQLAIGSMVGISTILNFALNAVVGWIPLTLAAFLSWQTGDPYRITRPGLRQRPTDVARRVLGYDTVESPTPSMPTPDTLPGKDRTEVHSSPAITKPNTPINQQTHDRHSTPLLRRLPVRRILPRPERHPLNERPKRTYLRNPKRTAPSRPSSSLE
ncbi:MAG: hypothetical protein ACP5OR_03280 [Candidatus Dormibacteria bacterium]